MNKYINAEMVDTNEIGYLKPVRPTWRTRVENVIGFLIIAGITAFIINAALKTFGI